LRLSQRETAAHGTGEQRRRTRLVVKAEFDAVVISELVLAQITRQIFLAAVLIRTGEALFETE
jgi:hypothetical protein